MLRAGGRLLLGFRPQEDGAAADFPETVYRFYTKDEVHGLLQAAGFSDAQLELAGGLAFATGHRPSGP